MSTLAGGAATLASGARKSADGAQALSNGTAKSAGGIDQLTGAVRKAVDGAALLEAETKGLADSGTTLKDGADALAKRLQASADDTGTYASETRTRMGDLAADPVAVEASRINAVAGTGGGLAPFLMAVAAWLGALGAFLVLPALRPGDDRRWWRAVLVALAGAAGAAIAGALLMALGMRFLVGVEAARLPELLGFAVLAALAFTAIVQALVAPFGSRGWLAALLFLVVQIAASGVLLTAGTAGPLGALRPFLPLTHAIDALRGAIYGGASSAAVDAAVLVAWLVVAVLVTLAVAAGAAADVGEEAEPAAA
jgi:putative membrane protein